MVCDVVGTNYLSPPSNAYRPWRSDELTKNMSAYKLGCKVEDVGDAKEVLGMMEAEFKLEWPRWPEEMLQGWLNKGRDVRPLEEFFCEL